jgi:hypothetical protein
MRESCEKKERAAVPFFHKLEPVVGDAEYDSDHDEHKFEPD